MNDTLPSVSSPSSQTLDDTISLAVCIELHLALGDLDKPKTGCIATHEPRCECYYCEKWRRRANRPTREDAHDLLKELRRMKVLCKTMADLSKSLVPNRLIEASRYYAVGGKW